jgi:hypothetical protein
LLPVAEAGSNRRWTPRASLWMRPALGLAGSVGEAVRHGPWWEVTVNLEEREPVVLFVDPEEYRIEHVERGFEDVVARDEFLAQPFGMKQWQLGQPLPGFEPEAFRPDIFSVEAEYGFHLHGSLVFGPDSSEIWFTDQVVPVVLGRSKSIWTMRWSEGDWGSPERAAFSGDFSGDGVWMSPDGQRIYFQSERPLVEGADPTLGFWRVERSGDGWLEPQLLLTAADVMGASGEFLPLRAMTADEGPWYVSAAFPGSLGAEDIYRAEYEEEHYGALVRLGGEINSDMEDYAVCVAPNESFLILYRFDPDRKETSGLYASFRDECGSWTDAVQIGQGTKLGAAFDASLSPDGEYLFFLSRGDGIYWVDAGILEAHGPGT